MLRLTEVIPVLDKGLPGVWKAQLPSPFSTQSPVNAFASKRRWPSLGHVQQAAERGGLGVVSPMAMPSLVTHWQPSHGPGICLLADLTTAKPSKPALNSWMWKKEHPGFYPSSATSHSSRCPGKFPPFLGWVPAALRWRELGPLSESQTPPLRSAHPSGTSWVILCPVLPPQSSQRLLDFCFIFESWNTVILLHGCLKKKIKPQPHKLPLSDVWSDHLMLGTSLAAGHAAPQGGPSPLSSTPREARRVEDSPNFPLPSPG